MGDKLVPAVALALDPLPFPAAVPWRMLISFGAVYFGESCQVHDECDNYISVYGDHVIEIEYPDAGRDHFAEACAAHGDKISIVLRDHDLSSLDNPDYRYKPC
jgi:hypothetical protein